MFENKKYIATFDWAENEDLEIPNSLQEVELNEMKIEYAVRSLAKLLFKRGLINATDDYSDHYNHDETECWVSFADDEKGLQLKYIVEEV